MKRAVRKGSSFFARRKGVHYFPRTARRDMPPAGGRSTPPIFFPEKENGRRPSKRKAFRLAVSILNNSYASGMQLPARGVAAVSVAIRFVSASIIRCCAAVGGSAALRMRHTPCGCRSADLVEVRSNQRLPPVSSMRRAQQCRYFARSLPPSKRHSRLTIVRRG